MEHVKLSEFTPDPKNANKGTERGRGMLEKSLQELGAGRSVLADKHGILIAGNKTFQTAIESGFEDAIVVESDGTRLVVVKRTDLDLSKDEKAKLLAVGDNRASEIGLEWDTDVLAELSQEVDLTGLWSEDDLTRQIESLESQEPSFNEWDEALGSLPDGDKAPFQQMTFTLHDDQVSEVKEALEVARKLGLFADSPNKNSNGNALARVCEIFLTQHGQS